MAQYIHGSAARKLEAAPQRAPQRRPLEEVKRSENRALAINNRRRQQFNMGYTVCTIAALMVILLVCFRYLELKSSVSEKAEVAARLEQSYSKLKSDNDFMEVAINSDIDYDYILDVAINELGMVYAKSSQVVSYVSEDIEYVKQFAEIPKK